MSAGEGSAPADDPLAPKCDLMHGLLAAHCRECGATDYGGRGFCATAAERQARVFGGRDPESASPYGPGNGPAPDALGLVAAAGAAASVLGAAVRAVQAVAVPQPRCLVIGHGSHGKDTAGEALAAVLGRPYASSSEFAAQKAVYPLLSDIYPDWRACYRDRRRHRALWFHAIAAYNLRPGPTLAEQILVDHCAYIGMRKRAEFEAVRALFDLVLWVDASKRLPPEPCGSMELTAADADVVLDNNGAPEALPGQVAAAVAAWSAGR